MELSLVALHKNSDVLIVLPDYLFNLHIYLPYTTQSLLRCFNIVYLAGRCS
jgi:hypothetical protein